MSTNPLTTFRKKVCQALKQNAALSAYMTQIGGKWFVGDDEEPPSAESLVGAAPAAIVVEPAPGSPRWDTNRRATIGYSLRIACGASGLTPDRSEELLFLIYSVVMEHCLDMFDGREMSLSPIRYISGADEERRQERWHAFEFTLTVYVTTYLKS